MGPQPVAAPVERAYDQRMFGPGPSESELIAGIVRVIVGVGLAWVAWWVTRRLPWPRPFRLSFLLAHLTLAPLLAYVWVVVSYPIEVFATTGHLAFGTDRLDERMFIGCIAYMFVVGPSYGSQGTARAARAEALAARTQLAALRAQLHPHFLFNALHTVVQLIPVEPERAAEAAEMVAGLLRTSVEEKRDEVMLEEEWKFVSRYLAVEQIRFGERLIVRADIPPELLDERVPSFALQTLVENAVQHGAAPRVAPTEILVTATGTATNLTVTVRNDGNARSSSNGTGTGTGLARLRERLSVLYGESARLSTQPLDGGGFEAVLVIPLSGARWA
jgi:two-component system, LytTR family, sensor kinase